MKQFTKNLNHKQTQSSVNLGGRLLLGEAPLRYQPLAPFVSLPLKNDTASTHLLKENKSLKQVVCLSFLCNVIHISVIMRVFRNILTKTLF